MKFDDIGLPFSQDCLRAALLVSLLCVWALVGLFYYLNRYAQKDYFNIWTGAWLFYALWMTLSLGLGTPQPASALFTIDQSCVSLAAVFLLWGSMRFLDFPVPKRLSFAFGLFIAVWILASPQMMIDWLQIHLPVFILLGLSTPFAAVCFFRLRKQNAFVGAGMLSLAFLLWVVYIASYPSAYMHGDLYRAGFFIAAGLQLIIAVGMVVLLFREVQREAEQVRAEVEAIRQEKEALQFKIISSKEVCQDLYQRMRASEESELAAAGQQRALQAAADRERLEELGQMTGNVANDLNNALTPITAYTELLLTTLTNLPAVPRERLQRISQAAENVALIVAHMREFYRAERGEPPVADEAVLNQWQPTPAETAAAKPRPLRVLFIDDEPQLRQVMRDVLDAAGHQVTAAPGGQQGLDFFRAHARANTPYDVVITDLGMPDVDGHQVARAIKAESPRTPIIMLTGWGTMMKTDGVKTPEVDIVLSKPPRLQELSALLFRVTARSI